MLGFVACRGVPLWFLIGQQWGPIRNGGVASESTKGACFILLLLCALELALDLACKVDLMVEVLRGDLTGKSCLVEVALLHKNLLTLVKLTIGGVFLCLIHQLRCFWVSYAAKP